MIFLQAADHPTGPSGACFEHVKKGQIELFTSPEIVSELQDLLNRPKIRQKFPTPDNEKVAGFLTEVDRLATSIAHVPATFSYPRDPKDEPYINLAIATDAEYLTSRDKDLLDLMRDLAFTTAYPNLRIL